MEEPRRTCCAISTAGKLRVDSQGTVGNRQQDTRKRRNTKMEVLHEIVKKRSKCYHLSWVRVDRNMHQTCPPVFAAVLNRRIIEWTTSKELCERNVKQKNNSQCGSVAKIAMQIHSGNVQRLSELFQTIITIESPRK